MNSGSYKRCNKCKLVKVASEFGLDKRNKDGHQGICKACSNESSKRYQANHPDESRKRAREWAALHQERAEKNKKRWRSTHSKQIREYNLKWKATNPEKVNMHTRNQHARKYKAPGNGITVEEWKQICEQYGNRCLVCGRTEKLTLDHIVPVSKGGLHESSNVQPLCDVCNAKKGTKTIDYRPVQLERVGGDYANQ